jgi:hypothetical protein
MKEEWTQHHAQRGQWNQIDVSKESLEARFHVTEKVSFARHTNHNTNLWQVKRSSTTPLPFNQAAGISGTANCTTQEHNLHTCKAASRTLLGADLPY